MHALVTGASQGIGAATARLLGREGYSVAVHGNRHDTGPLLADLHRAQPDSFAVKADLSTPEGVDTAADAVAARWTTLDAVVLNAGTYPRQSFADADDPDYDEAHRLHVRGPARLVRRLLPQLRAAAAPGVVFVSSVLGFTGSRHGAPYAAAKAGVLGLSMSLARELAPHIRVNAVAPGAIDTAILAHEGEAERATRSASIPLGRIGTPEEVAEAIVFLVSRRASYITGTTLHVNGGWRTG